MTSSYNTTSEGRAFDALLVGMLRLNGGADRDLMLCTESGYAAEEDQRLLRETSEMVTRDIIDDSRAAAQRKPQSCAVAVAAPSNELLDEWWKAFKRSGDEASRNALLEHHLPIVKYIAERIHAKLPDEVELDDLISAGIFGLMDALSAFDAQRGGFEVFCAKRVRGAIMDELRSMDWLPRLVRSQSLKLNEATDALEKALGREPTGEELAKHLATSKMELHKLRRDAQADGLGSQSRRWYETDSQKDVREIDVLEARRNDDLRRAQAKDLKELITRSLSRAERLVIILYYFEEMTMKEIGLTLDLPESQINQMHSDILSRLRHRLDKRQKELKAVGA